MEEYRVKKVNEIDVYKRQVMTVLDEQSTDIAMGVDKSLEAKNGEDKDDLDTGAGDQGMMLSLIHI